jgi:hypothetical protein
VDALTVLSFTPVVLYLAVVSVLLLTTGRCPEWVHPLAVALGFPILLLTNGWLLAVLGVASGIALLIIVILFGSRVLSGTSVFTLCATLALLPAWNGMLALPAGVVIAVGAAVIQTAATSGWGKVTGAVNTTVMALGALGGSVGAPDIGMLAGAGQVARNSRGPVLHLAPCLLAGVLLTAGVLAMR